MINLVAMPPIAGRVDFLLKVGQVNKNLPPLYNPRPKSKTHNTLRIIFFRNISNICSTLRTSTLHFLNKTKF